MGNVAISEALRAHPANNKLINTYIASQSAEVAHAYQPDLPLTRGESTVPDLYRYNPPNPRPRDTSAQGDNYYKGLSSRTINKFINFGNIADPALGAWDWNQALKPSQGWWPSDTEYKYIAEPHTYVQGGETIDGIRDTYWEDPPGITGGNVEHEIFWPNDGPTILAQIIPARCRATGATTGVSIEFNPEAQVNLSVAPYSYDTGGRYDHSAQFQSTFMKLAGKNRATAR
jgi:hypothetical protein